MERACLSRLDWVLCPCGRFDRDGHAEYASCPIGQPQCEWPQGDWSRCPVYLCFSIVSVWAIISGSGPTGGRPAMQQSQPNHCIMGWLLLLAHNALQQLMNGPHPRVRRPMGGKSTLGLSQSDWVLCSCGQLDWDSHAEYLSCPIGQPQCEWAR